MFLSYFSFPNSLLPTKHHALSFKKEKQRKPKIGRNNLFKKGKLNDKKKKDNSGTVVVRVTNHCLICFKLKKKITPDTGGQEPEAR